MDGFSTSRMLVQELVQRDVECVHLFSRPDFGLYHIRSFDPSNYAVDLGYDALGLLGNDVARSHARRDKAAMAKVIHDAGLAAPSGKLVSPATGTKTSRSSRYATRSQCCNANSATPGCASARPTGHYSPRSCTNYHARSCADSVCWSARTRSCAGTATWIVERWVQTCRHELLDRFLIWNQRHLLHALHEYEQFYNSHSPHQGIANARPLRPLPEPITNPTQITRLDIRRRPRLGGILNEYHHAA